MYCLPLADLKRKMHRLRLNSFLNESDDSASDEEGESEMKKNVQKRPAPTSGPERAGTPWVICSSCGQWFHCRCVDTKPTNSPSGTATITVSSMIIIIFIKQSTYI